MKSIIFNMSPVLIHFFEVLFRLKRRASLTPYAFFFNFYVVKRSLCRCFFGHWCGRLLTCEGETVSYRLLRDVAWRKSTCFWLDNTRPCDVKAQLPYHGRNTFLRVLEIKASLWMAISKRPIRDLMSRALPSCITGIRYARYLINNT